MKYQNIHAAALVLSAVLASCGLAGGPEKMRGSAEAALQRGDYSEAAIVLRNLLSKTPEDAGAQLLLSKVQVRQGNFDAAAIALDAAAAQGAPEAVVARQRSLLAIERGEFDAVLQTLAAEGPASLDAETKDYLRARALQGLGRMPESLALYTSLAAKQPDSAELQLRIAQCHAYHGRVGPAEEALVRAIDLSGKKGAESVAAEAWLLRLAIARRGGDRSAVDEALAQVLQHAPGQLATPVHATLLAEAIGDALSRGELASARDRLSVLTRILPQSSLTEIVKAQVQLAGEKPADAVATLQQLRQTSPEFSAARPLLVAALLRTGAMEQARKEANDIAAQAPDAAALRRLQAIVNAAAEQPDGSSERSRMMAAVLLELQQPAVAHALLSDALAALPEDRALRIALVQMNLRTGRLEDAMAGARELIKANPADHVAAALLAEVQLARKDYAASAATYASLWESEPGSGLANALFRTSKLAGLPDPRRPLEQWLRQQPGDVAVRMNLALDLQSTGEDARAIREYEQVLARSDNTNTTVRAIALNNLAWLYHQQSDPRALDTARRANEIAPGQATIADTYGWLLLQNGRIKDALPLLAEAAASSPESTPIRYHHAAALARSGEESAARELLTDVLLDQAPFDGRADAEGLLVRLKAP